MSERQKQIFKYLSEGLVGKDIASNLNISISTVRDHIRTVLKSRNYKNIANAIYNLTKSGII